MGKRKFTAAQAREALLDAGYDLLVDIGPAGIGGVTLAEAITKSGVPRPSAYRLFGASDKNPQSSFQEALLVRVIDTAPGLPASDVLEAVVPILAKANTLDRPEHADELTGLLADAFAVMSRMALERLLNDPKTAVYYSAMALVDGGSGSPAIRRAIADHRARLSETYVAFFRQGLNSFGLRLRPPWSEPQVFKMANAATMGAILSARASEEPDAAATGTALLTASFLAVTAMTTEPDPRRVVTAQPQRLLLWGPRQLATTP